MTRLFAAASAAALLALAPPALAELEAGAAAPPFAADGWLGGAPFAFDLEAALEDGPVVLYFFPAAFTPGCNAEAALFAQSADAFAEAGATLIGVTGGNTDRLAEFSEKHCASKFPVAGVGADVIAAYDVGLAAREGWSDRTSYVIAPDGAIAFSYSDMNPSDHVDQTLSALQGLGD